MTGLPGFPCPVCRRAGGEVAISIAGYPLVHTCSIECAGRYVKGLTMQVDMAEFEREAAISGGEKGGAYLDEIGTSDLASLTKEEWGEFCARVFAGACDALRARAADEIPF